MRDGERAGGRQIIHVFAALAFAFGAVLGSLDVLGPLLSHDTSVAWPALVFTAVWLTITGRLMRTGVYTTGRGVRIRTLPRTVTYPWPAITTAEPHGDELHLTLTTGREVRTPVRRVPHRTGYHGRDGIHLDPADFNTLLNQLHAQLNNRSPHHTL